MGFKDRPKKEPEPEAAPIETGKVKNKWKGASERIGQGDHVPVYEDITEAPKRIVAASAALQKRGKTTFGFSLPKPLAYLQLDANYEHALAAARKQYKKKDAIRHIRYFADPRADIKSANAAVFDRFCKDFDYCVDNFRGVFIDTTSELLDVRKLAEYGRITSIMQMYYGSIYADFRWMVNRALKSNCNVIFVHRMKKEYRDDVWSGGYELEGWRGMLYETQVYVEHQRDAENDSQVFTTNIVECSQNALLMGGSLSSDDDDNSFAHLAQRIFPDSELGDWS